MQNKPRRIIHYIVIALLTAAAGLYIYFENSQNTFFQSRELLFMETGVRLTFGFDDKASVYTNGNRAFFLATRDGVRGVSSDGHIRWDKAYSIQELLTDVF